MTLQQIRFALDLAIVQLEPDALELLVLIAERLVAGRKLYGSLDLDTDKRDWSREALEEDSDGLVYRAAMSVLALRKSRS